jgi:hypothetical protein
VTHDLEAELERADLAAVEPDDDGLTLDERTEIMRVLSGTTLADRVRWCITRAEYEAMSEDEQIRYLDEAPEWVPIKHAVKLYTARVAKKWREIEAALNPPEAPDFQHGDN